MKRSIKVEWMMGVLLTLLSPALARAQAVANAAIRGSITDSTGAVVPGAQVKATQTNTGQVLTTISNSEGSYVLPNLPVGPYTLQVTAQAFSNYLQSGIILQVADSVQINVQLQVGTVSQEMIVSANAAMVQTQDTTISEVVDQRRIIDLPLNGRQATDLTFYPGAFHGGAERRRPGWLLLTITRLPLRSPFLEDRKMAITICSMAGIITTRIRT